MAEYKQGDKVVLTRGESKVVGTVQWVGVEYIDVKPEGTSQSVAVKADDWRIEPVLPTNSEILAALKAGSVFHYNNEGTKYVAVDTGSRRRYINARYGDGIDLNTELFTNQSTWKITVDYEA
jgi:hypothetical protein